ncbi:MAG: Na+/H+ antiporter NhaA [Bacteroidetes bacterium]|nr:Na+/H+ antiporter NhaA [Bacteroidota bacterium]
MSAQAPKSRLRLTALFKEFFKSQQSAGILLVLTTVVSLLLANSAAGPSYIAFWSQKIGLTSHQFHLEHSITEWINDALMTIFFLLVGLEIERELYIGELSDRKRALLPMMGALGGMIVPALIYLLFNFNHPQSISGAGIPTATDIAFAIAIMGLLGDRVPAALKVFLTALAIIDDLGAIVVIALFYGGGFNFLYLGLSAVIGLVLYRLNQKENENGWLFLFLGISLWFCMLHSGVHATLAGVILAFALPFKSGKPNTLSYRVEHKIQWPVTYIILPLFALANTAIAIPADTSAITTHPASLGTFFGLVLGKPLGIVIASLIAVKLGIATLSQSINLRKLIGAGILGGIGFTMAIFVDNLAFTDTHLIDLVKVSILIASTTCATLGFVLLKLKSRI